MSHLCPWVEKAVQSPSPKQHPQQKPRLQMVYHLAAILGHLHTDQSRHAPHHNDGHNCHQHATWAGSPGPWHSLQPAACAVQAVGLRLYMHQLGHLHKVPHVAMPSNERGVRRDGCLSIHHFPRVLAWPEEARSDKKWETELTNSSR